MRLDKRRLILLLLLAFIVSVTVIIAQQQEQVNENTVKDFQVEDIPADDGSGLMLAWKPLDRSKRIIEYRVYRGVSPDQLFFLDYIQVNPKSGVASDLMYYYDSSASEISDITHPRKLKLEKGQPADGILYGKPPRNLKYTATMMEKFQMISLAKRNDFYFGTKEITEDPEAEEVNSFAGLKYNQQTVLAMLKPGTEYYYAVVAVDERRQLFPRTEVKSAIPVPNAPDPSPALHSVILEDLQELRFEWEYPLYRDALAQYRILQVAAMPDSVWDIVRQNPEAVISQAREITSGPVGSGSLPNYTKLELGEEILNYANARFVLQLIDYNGASSLSPLSAPRLLNSDALPAQTKYWVEDKPNDKGATLNVVWDHPIIFVVKTTSLNEANTKLRINYQLNKTDNQEVKNIWFEFLDPVSGAQIAKLKEFYQDRAVTLKLPKGYDFEKGLKVRITMEGKPEFPADYAIEQDLKYDPSMLALLPSDAIYRKGREVSDIFNIVYRKYMHSSAWRLVMRNTSFDNSLEVTIPYSTMAQKLVQGIAYAEGDSMVFYMSSGERKSRLLIPGESRAPRTLMSHEVDFVWDEANEVLVKTSIFSDPAKRMQAKAIKTAEEKIAELEGTKASATDPEQIASIEAAIGKEQAIIKAYNSDVVMSAMNAKSNRNRLKQVLKAYDDYTRRQAFMVVKTDTKGLFVESTPEMTEGKFTYMMPVSNWFDTNKYVTLFATILFFIIVVVFINLSRRGKNLYIRPIAGLQEIDNAIGRATEMGRPMLYCMGNGSLSDVATIASMGILSIVAKKAAEYDTKLIVPCYDYIVMPIAQEIVREAHYAVGRPDSYDRNNVFYLTNVQFAYVAGVNGIMIRERMATNFFMGYFAAEALLMTETGNAVGAVQIAGTDAVTQIPFFITTCQFTLIGEELYAASAYLNREPMLLGNLKAQDYFKLLITSIMLVGAILATFEITGLTLMLPDK